MDVDFTKDITLLRQLGIIQMVAGHIAEILQFFRNRSIAAIGSLEWLELPGRANGHAGSSSGLLESGNRFLNWLGNLGK
jgi:hypothetical protein